MVLVADCGTGEQQSVPLAVFVLESLFADHWDTVVTEITDEIRVLCLVVLFTLFASDQAVSGLLLRSPEL